MNVSPNDLLGSINRGNSTATKHVGVGALIGLTWGCSLRAWMALLALQLGENPQITWKGTFVGVLLPATLVGALDGRAVYVAKTSERKRWRWVLLSPSLLILGPLIGQKDFISTLLTTGLGGGAIGVALVGMLGGYACSRFGLRWTCGVAAFFALLWLIAKVVPTYLFGTSSARKSSGGEAFITLLFVLLMLELVVGTSTPSRAQPG